MPSWGWAPPWAPPFSCFRFPSLARSLEEAGPPTLREIKNSPPFRSPQAARCPRHTEAKTGTLNPGTDEIRRLKIPLIGALRWRLPSALRCDPIDEAEEK